MQLTSPPSYLCGDKGFRVIILMNVLCYYLATKRVIMKKVCCLFFTATSLEMLQVTMCCVTLPSSSLVKASWSRSQMPYHGRPLCSYVTVYFVSVLNSLRSLDGIISFDGWCCVRVISISRDFFSLSLSWKQIIKFFP